MPDAESTPILLAQILAKQGEMSVQLAVAIKQLEAIPDHEQRLRTLELADAQDLGAARARAAVWAAAISVVTAGSALAVVLIHR